MKAAKRDKLKKLSSHLLDTYGMSYGQISRYLSKKYGVTVHRSTVFRWINL
jgi:intein-encoded DNA endonuclease-like protein